MKKKVIQVREKPKLIPRQLPPMDRPVTPRNDLRSVNSARGSNLHNLSITRFSDLNEPGISCLDSIKQLFDEAKNTDDLAFAVESFEKASESLEEAKSFANYDLNSYHNLYPHLEPLIDTAPGHIQILLVNSLKHILNAIELSNSVKDKSIKPPTTPNTRKTSSRLKKLEPLPPLEENDNQKSKAKAKKDSPTEHFNQFMSKILYKMSNEKDNDKYFTNPDLVYELISLTTDSHKIDTRTYAAATLKNETHDNESFRQMLTKMSNFSELFQIFESPTKKPQLLQQCAGLMRNMINDSSSIELLINNDIHIHLFKSMIRFSDNADYCYCCFRILTKISDQQRVRTSLFQTFQEEGVLSLFYSLLNKHKSHSLLISRLVYTFADFASHEPDFIVFAGKMTNPFSISEILETIDCPEISSNKEVIILLIQLVANLSVDKECSSLLAFGSTISKLFVNRTFKEDDKLGYNLLCTASNFTFHDHYWSPKEVIDAIPIAIVSQHVPSIIEALRTLCNLALAPNTMLVDSKIFELLGILIKHVNPDIVLYSLQTLANLINHAGIRRRFRSAGLVESLLDLLEGDELDELELEAIAALIMNFGAITPEEANKFYDALQEFEIPQDAAIPNAFIEFLQQQLKVNC